MNTKTRRVRLYTPLSEEKIAEAEELLRRLSEQEKPQDSRKSPLGPALERLKPFIHAARAKRYTYEDIAKQLLAIGVPASAETIRRHAGAVPKRRIKKSTRSTEKAVQKVTPKADTVANPVANPVAVSVNNTDFTTAETLRPAHAGALRKQRL